jgi:hypothetical protein
MKILGAIAMIALLATSGCIYHGPHQERADVRRAHESFRRARRQAHEDFQRARRDFQRDLRGAREELRHDMEEARQDFHRQFDRW